MEMVGEAKFTPGPWKVFRGHLVTCNSDGSIPLNSKIIMSNLDGVERANARLIAAAPDLLESCKPAELRQAAILLRASGMDDAATALEKIAAKQDAAITRATTP